MSDLKLTLWRIIEICEGHQNRCIEGSDPDEIMREDDETINLICKTASDALRHCEGVQNLNSPAWKELYKRMDAFRTRLSEPPKGQ
jgi:hypothetical protein